MVFDKLLNQLTKIIHIYEFSKFLAKNIQKIK